MHYLLQILSILTNIQKDIIILLNFFFFDPFTRNQSFPSTHCDVMERLLPRPQSHSISLWGDTPLPKRIKGPKAGSLCPTKCGPGRKHGPLRILATQLRASPSSLFTFLSSCTSRYVWSCSFSTKLPLSHYHNLKSNCPNLLQSCLRIFTHAVHQHYIIYHSPCQNDPS